MTGLVDTHCHLQDRAFDVDREEVVARSLAELAWLVVIGDALASSENGVRLVREGVYAAVGIHPYHPEQANPGGLSRLRDLAREPGVVAIGEIGLDYYRHNTAPRESQQAAFRAQLRLAADLGLPVVIHNRDAHDDTAALLDEFHRDLPGGIMHCFAGGPAFVERCLQWGFHVSFAGNVTFPKAAELREAALAVPLDRLLVETDSPYLAPQALRGKRCEPVYVQHTARALASLKGIDLEALAAATSENARRLFGVANPSADYPMSASK